MVVIRLARAGAKKNPFYQIVASDKRNSRDGRFIEKLGYFNPLARGKATNLTCNIERVDYWLNKGAQPSERVQKLIKDFKKQGTEVKVVPTKAQQRAEQADAAAKAQAEKAKKEQAEALKAAKAEEAAKAAEATEEATTEETKDAE